MKYISLKFLLIAIVFVSCKNAEDRRMDLATQELEEMVQHHGYDKPVEKKVDSSEWALALCFRKLNHIVSVQHADAQSLRANIECLKNPTKERYRYAKKLAREYDIEFKEYKKVNDTAERYFKRH